MDSALVAGEAKFDDWKEQYPWALTLRGFGYYELRKPSEALADLVLADEVTREGNDQASFVINLALTQVRLGKADDAMTTIDRVGSTSDFGALLTAHVYHMAHLSKGERALSEAALSRRAQALIEVQHYREPPPTAVTRLVVERKQQLLAMPDVRAAILEVGRIESFDFPEP
jgi:hypothetical protein